MLLKSEIRRLQPLRSRPTSVPSAEMNRLQLAATVLITAALAMACGGTNDLTGPVTTVPSTSPAASEVTTTVPSTTVAPSTTTTGPPASTPTAAPRSDEEQILDVIERYWWTVGNAFDPLNPDAAIWASVATFENTVTRLERQYRASLQERASGARLPMGLSCSGASSPSWMPTQRPLSSALSTMPSSTTSRPVSNSQLQRRSARTAPTFDETPGNGLLRTPCKSRSFDARRKNVASARCLALPLQPLPSQAGSTGIPGSSHRRPRHQRRRRQQRLERRDGGVVSNGDGRDHGRVLSELAIVSEPDRTVGTRRPVGCFYFVVIDSEPHIETFGRAEALALYEQRTNTDNPVGIHCFFIDTRAAIAGYPRVWIPPPTPGAQPPLIDIVELEIWARNQLTFTPPPRSSPPPVISSSGSPAGSRSQANSTTPRSLRRPGRFGSPPRPCSATLPGTWATVTR